MPFNLSQSNKWLDFPDLNLEIDLKESMSVPIIYTITTKSVLETQLFTTLYIDDKEYKEYRVITGNSLYHTNHHADMVRLEKGKHKIVVKYRTPGEFEIKDGEDF